MRGVTAGFAVTLLSLGAAGCTFHSARLPIGPSHNPSAPEVIVVIDAAPARAYEVVGKVHSHCRWNWLFGWAACGEKTMRQRLKGEAAYLGADGLIDVTRTSFSQFEWTDVHYHATAVRWE